MSSQKSEPYHLIYWPGIPGRGEHIRLALEEAQAEYTDTAHISDGVKSVLAHISTDNKGDDSPPPLAPPILKHGSLTLSQTSNILLYLGQQLGLAPDITKDPAGYYAVNALALTALDGLSNEPHDVHHPIAVGDFYEAQKPEAARKAKDYREHRLPKFLEYFERVLGRGSGWLVGEKLTYSDLVLFHVIDGIGYAFPKCVERLRGSGKYEKVFELHEKVAQRENVKKYLESERRQKYSMGIYRHYPELDE